MNFTLKKISLIVVLTLGLPLNAFSQSRLITVSGDAEVRVVPDEVILTLGVETWDKVLSKELGQRAGKLQSIQENSLEWWSWYNSGWGSRWGGAMAQNVIQNAGNGSSAEGSIAPGQITVTARVTVSFELESEWV